MLEVSNVYRQYKNGFRLDNISLNIDDGDFFVVFGPDDSGKSELLYTIMGLHRNRHSKVMYEGKLIDKLSDNIRRNIRFVPDDVLMADNMTGEEYINSIIDTYGITDLSMKTYLQKYFKYNLSERLTDMTYENNKFVAVAGAVISRPKLLILDEPANFLTTIGYKRVLKMLKFANMGGTTILLAAEHFGETESICNRFMYLNDGKIVCKCKVNKPIEFSKAITVYNGDYDILQKYMGNPIAKNDRGITYLYSKDKGNLYNIFLESKVGNQDFVIEPLTMEEMIDKDYRRWQFL